MASFARAFRALMHRISISSIKDPYFIQRKPPKTSVRFFFFITKEGLVHINFSRFVRNSVPWRGFAKLRSRYSLRAKREAISGI